MTELKACPFAAVKQNAEKEEIVNIDIIRN